MKVQIQSLQNMLPVFNLIVPAIYTLSNSLYLGKFIGIHYVCTISITLLWAGWGLAVPVVHVFLFRIGSYLGIRRTDQTRIGHL